ncbi:hypothetical protein J2X61_000198 [Bacillus sp. 3255]|nr:hypothetical protein [Bacillus sp. 3255]
MLGILGVGVGVGVRVGGTTLWRLWLLVDTSENGLVQYEGGDESRTELEGAKSG